MMGSPAVGSLLFRLKDFDTKSSGAGTNHDGTYHELLSTRGRVAVVGSAVGGTALTGSEQPRDWRTEQIGDWRPAGLTIRQIRTWIESEKRIHGGTALPWTQVFADDSAPAAATFGRGRTLSVYWGTGAEATLVPIDQSQASWTARPRNNGSLPSYSSFSVSTNRLLPNLRGRDRK